MDKVIIYGALDFLGFHFCNRFLEKGYCVKGIHFPGIANNYLNEKRLAVGRNANFEELTMQDVKTHIEDNEEAAIVIFPLYDLYLTGNEAILTKPIVSERIFHFLSCRKECQDKMIYLLPIQLLSESLDMDGIRELRDFLKQTNRITNNMLFFYLPTIFGQWQPPDFLFQRAISNQLKFDKDPVPSREWMLDAIFIEDALNAIIDIIEEKKEGRFLLESGIPESWEKCADILQIDKMHRNGGANLKLTTDEQLERITLTKITPLEESLLRQRDHLSQLSWLGE